MALYLLDIISIYVKIRELTFDFLKITSILKIVIIFIK